MKQDKIDRHILRILQNEGRIANVVLANRVGLSPSPCLERVKRLEASGLIEGYKAELNAEKLGFSLLAFIEVSLAKTGPDVFDDFKQAAQKVPEIQECHMVAGGFDYLLKIRVADMPAYRRFLGEVVSRLPGVDRTHTYTVMEEVKSTRSLAI